jgi:hypothetical protein
MARPTGVAAGLDVLAVLVFVAIGRRSHDEGSAIGEFVKTAAPLAIALVAGWLLARAWRSPLTISTGAVIWMTTVALGMLVRRFVFDRGTAVSFVIVATVFLGLCLVGWRAAVGVVLARRQNSIATAGTS